MMQSQMSQPIIGEVHQAEYAMPREGMADEAKVLSHTAHVNQSIAAAACGIGNCRLLLDSNR